MIQTTNQTKDFIEKISSPLMIYTAGHAAYWTGDFLKRCNIDFLGYIDKSVPEGGAYYYGKPIFPPDKLKEFAGQTLRLIVPGKSLPAVIKDLETFDAEIGLNLICLVPVYNKRGSKTEHEYNINKMLGYFRRKLLKYDIPTIFCNGCSTGVIYEFLLDTMCLTPFFNNNLSYEDFITFCKNPRPYLEEPLEDLYWQKAFHHLQEHYVEYVPAATLGKRGGVEPIELIFTHTDNFDEVKERWNFLREHVDWDNVAYVLQNARGRIPYNILRQFSEIEGQKLIVYGGLRMDGIAIGGEPYYDQFDFTANIPHAAWMTIAVKHIVAEDNFDVVGWLNRDYLSEG